MHENRVYSCERLLIDPLAMPKHATSAAEGFGPRLAALRKTAGYTQQQLADEIGASRRVIAYYEAESEHPPANLLVDLARVLNVSVDELLGLATAKRPRESGLSPRLERRLRQIERLSPKPKQQLLSLIDTFIAAEQLRQAANTSKDANG
jgi:transcriptional regulator with XRE-family HTH domain